jgi:hypothetical protein
MGSPGPPTAGPPFDIPDFSISGVLPPYLGPTPVMRALMSPYSTTLTRIAGKLCASNERREIFRGFLLYRKQLASIGFTSGLQWLSGSFMEDIENLEKRHPRDVDVVTFFYRPSAATDDVAFQAFILANANLLTRGAVKPLYKCDPFFVDLNTEGTNIVNQARYWFGLFSHRRGGLWKGLLQVPLAITEDDSEASQLVGV